MYVHSANVLSERRHRLEYAPPTHKINFNNCVDYVPQNGEEMALSRVGKELYELLFKHYTKKQVQLHAGVYI